MINVRQQSCRNELIMEKNKEDNLKKTSENESLTAVRLPAEDIIKGAGEDDAITEAENNRSDEGPDKERQRGAEPRPILARVTAAKILTPIMRSDRS